MKRRDAVSSRDLAAHGYFVTGRLGFCPSTLNEQVDALG